MFPAFLCAAVDGDVESLELMLSEDAVLDAGEVIAGAGPIADFLAHDPRVAFDLELIAVDGLIRSIRLPALAHAA
jgi:hypothetical protein